MFWILAVIGGIGFVGCAVWLFSDNNTKSVAIICAIVCLIIFIAAWLTPQGKLYWSQLMATSKTGNWLVVDNSGGKTMRHWILKKSYVQSSDKSDGWKFTDFYLNGPIYVSGDAFVMRIVQPLDEFLKTYKQKYNIPVDQEALH